MSSVLEIRQINKSFGNKKIIDNLSFSVNAGEIIGFVGPNGSGKTTTIKMLTGLLSLDSGEVFINGKDITKHFEEAMACVGAIVENPELYSYLTGMQNLNIFARMYSNITEERVNEIVSLVKLKNRIDEKVNKYSLGMRQRLGIAQALLHNPQLLILDEPTNGLDPAGIRELRELLQELSHQNGLAVLVSSHMLSEMELLCDRFGVIDKGRMVDFIDMNVSAETTSVRTFRYHLEIDDYEIGLKAIRDYQNELAKETNELPAFKVSYENNQLQIMSSRDQIAQINEVLVKSGIYVYAIEKIHSSLEDEFLKITASSDGQIQ